MKAKVRFFYDIVCPYAYLASTQIKQLLPYADVEWVPILLGGIFKHLQAPQVPALQMSTGKQLMNHLELYRWAKQWQVSFSFSQHHPQRSVEAMRLLCAIEDPLLLERVTQRLYQAYWQNQERLDIELLTQISLDFQLPPLLWTQEQAKQKLIQQTQQAFELGIFGVPSFIVDDQIFWGQDRISLLIDHIKPQKNILRFYHDFSSPFSFLASTQIQAFAKLHAVELQAFPILLGALFKEINTPQVPLLSMNASKQAYVLKDLDRWAKHWGIPLKIPSFFPFKSTTLLRLSLLEPKLINHIYHAIWVENLDIHEGQALHSFLIQYESVYGYDADLLLEKANRDEIKEKLRQNTAFAVENQVFGVPTIEVLHLNPAQKQYQEELQKSANLNPKALLFWGQDRFDQLSEFLKRT